MPGAWEWNNQLGLTLNWLNNAYKQTFRWGSTLGFIEFL